MGSLGYRHFVYSFVLISTGAFLFGCSKKDSVSGSTSQPELTRNSELRQGELSRDRARFRNADSEAESHLDVQRYDVKAEFNWETRRLEAVATITLRLLDLAATEIALESRAFKIHSVTLKDKSNLSFQHEGGVLKVSLRELSDEIKSEPLTLLVNYEASADTVGAGDPSSLTSVPVRSSDPVKARVAYTTSEPIGAPDWLPCHNIPSDRAFFSIEVAMAPEERLIANGDLVEDRIAGTRRVMKYQTRYTIPTYLMAFGVGDFEFITEREGNLPVSIWYRKGLPGTYREVLEQLRLTIRHYEKLIGPYPFEKYSLVLLPEFPSGGLENASITFQAENRSTESRLSSDFGLSTHELGHQWFGDYVTVKGWDDLWIKEGMATLLAEESTRSFEDAKGSGRLFGQNFWTSEGDAIRDSQLKPDDKYTTGPYDRAAWLLTQIRSAVGETKFWGALRAILKKYAFSSVSTEEFLAQFAPYLDRSTFQKLTKAVDAKRLPHLSLVKEDESSKTFLLTDPDGALIQPLEVTWLSEEGKSENFVWEPGKEWQVDKSETRLLVLDPRDFQALGAFVAEKGFVKTHFAGFVVPRTVKQLALFRSLPASAQAYALEFDSGWNLSAEEAGPLFESLGSEAAKFEATTRFCEQAEKSSGAGWTELIRNQLSHPAWLGIPRWSSSKGLGACLKLIPNLFDNQWNALTESAENQRASDLHLYTFMPQAPAASEKMWRKVYEKSNSIRTQLLSLTGLSRHNYAGTAFEADKETKRSIQTFLQTVLRTSDSAEVQNSLLGLSFLIEKDSVKELADLILRTSRVAIQTRAACVAYTALEKNKELWSEFLKLLGGLEKFPTNVKELLSDPESECH